MQRPTPLRCRLNLSASHHFCRYPPPRSKPDSTNQNKFSSLGYKQILCQARIRTLNYFNSCGYTGTALHCHTQKYGADGETRTHTACAATPSRWCVYQFHHVGNFVSFSSKLRVSSLKQHFKNPSFQTQNPRLRAIFPALPAHRPVSAASMNRSMATWAEYQS